MYHNVYAMGLLPDEQGELDGWTNLIMNVEEAIRTEFGGAGQGIEVEVDGDRLRLYMSSSDDARSLCAQLDDFYVDGDDEAGGWSFAFDLVEVD